MRISDWSSDVFSSDLCVMFGVNSRLDVVSAEVLKFRLDRLKGVVEARRRNADIYRSIIKPGHVFIPEEKAHEQVSYVMFIAQCDDRDRLQKYLADHGVQTLVYYGRSEEHTSELQSLMRISYAVFCLKKKN